MGSTAGVILKFLFCGWQQATSDMRTRYTPSVGVHVDVPAGHVNAAEHLQAGNACM